MVRGVVQVVVHGGEVPGLQLPLLLVLRQEAWLLPGWDGNITLHRGTTKYESGDLYSATSLRMDTFGTRHLSFVERWFVLCREVICPL